MNIANEQAVFEIKVYSVHLPGAKTQKMVHPAI